MNTIYTVGYEGLELPDLAQWADLTNAIVLDCRFKPWSRRAEWSRPHLTVVLGDRYLWLGRCFGNVNYTSPAMADVVLADPERGVRITGRILERQPICLLCLEADHWYCHRAEVADLIAEATGATVVPLTAADLSAQGRLL